jgi:protein-tyrosine phosphatase
MSAEEPWWSDLAGVVFCDEKGTPRLLVGSLAAAEDQRLHEELSISHVLSVAGGALKVKLGEKGAHVEHLTVDIADHPAANILEVLPRCLDFIDEALRVEGSCVLVHCASGVSRSVSVCCAFLMLRKHAAGLTEALERVRGGRSQANPNYGFKAQLDVLEKASGDIAEAIKRVNSGDGPQGVMASVQSQRSAANDAHARADDLEVRVATAASRGNPETAGAKESLLQDLQALRDDLNSIFESSTAGVVDRPARSVHKSAVSKVQRLEEMMQAM